MKYFDKLGDTQYLIVAILFYSDDLNYQKKLDISSGMVSRIIKEANDLKPSDANGDTFQPSLFKRLAYMTVMTVKDKPFGTEFPQTNIESYNKIRSIKNHQNIAIALKYSLYCLQSSYIGKKKENNKLKRIIWLSDHSYVDLICAINTLVEKAATNDPHALVPIIALLYEQLVYKTNPEHQYGFVKETYPLRF